MGWDEIGLRNVGDNFMGLYNANVLLVVLTHSFRLLINAIQKTMFYVLYLED
jgi:hypothetical protein